MAGRAALAGQVQRGLEIAYFINEPVGQGLLAGPHAPVAEGVELIEFEPASVCYALLKDCVVVANLRLYLVRCSSLHLLSSE